MYRLVFFSVVLHMAFEIMGKHTVFMFKYPLEAPDVFEVTAMEPPGLYITWSSIRQGAENPVLGFKIIISTLPLTIETKHERVNGKQFLQITYKNNIKADKNLNSNSTITNVRELTINGIGKTSYTVTTDIKYNELYEVRLFAFNRDGSGPMTKPIRVQIVKGSGYHAYVQKKGGSCFVSVPSFVWGTDSWKKSEEYPYLRNSHF